MRKFPFRSVRELLDTDLVTIATRKALLDRESAGENYEPQFFDSRDYATLKAVCRALAPSRAVPPEFVPSEIDRRLKGNIGNGWRYDRLPADGEAFRRALRGFDAIACQKFGTTFHLLEPENQNEILLLVRSGKIHLENGWGIEPALFLEDLLAEFAETFYAHPYAQREIGYVGFADAYGWQKIGLDQHDDILNHKDAGERLKTQRVKEIPRKNERPMRLFAENEVVDAVVIGTGAGGAPIIARLAKAGLKIVALEAGKDLDYRAFATDEREQSKLFWLDERLSAGKNALPFGANNSGCGVGGSTLHFTAYTPRPQADDFRIFSDFGVGHDWCLSYEDLEPYYDELEWFLGVSGPSPYPWGKRRNKSYPLPPLPLNGAAQLMRRGCQHLGIKTAPAANAALSGSYYQEGVGWRRACTNRGFCQAGCSTGAKASMDVTFLPLATEHGAEIRAECFALEFEFDSLGRIQGVVYSQNGELKKQLCRNVFLCAGAIETPRLLLINDCGNRSGQVGRNFMAHPGVQVWGVFDEEVYPHKGIPGGLISEDTHRPQKHFGANFVGGYLLQSIGAMPVTYASQLARGEKIWGEQVGGWMEDYNRTAGINIHGECLAYEHNFVELADEKDSRGLPKPRVHFSFGENEEKMTAHAERLMGEIWQAAGARRTWTFHRSAHILGTCRMGMSGEDSVVDRNGRSFDVPNLYICDNSIFPSSLSVNPALTIMALALRTADEFLKY